MCIRGLPQGQYRSRCTGASSVRQWPKNIENTGLARRCPRHRPLDCWALAISRAFTGEFFTKPGYTGRRYTATTERAVRMTEQRRDVFARQVDQGAAGERHAIGARDGGQLYAGRRPSSCSAAIGYAVDGGGARRPGSCWRAWSWARRRVLRAGENDLQEMTLDAEEREAAQSRRRWPRDEGVAWMAGAASARGSPSPPSAAIASTRRALFGMPARWSRACASWIAVRGSTGRRRSA